MQRLSLAAIFVLAIGSVVSAAETATLLKQIRNVQKQGVGNVTASQALRELADQEPAVIPTILEAFEDANPLATNYLRSAVETIADKAIKNDQPLPTAKLVEFIENKRNNPQARSLAYDLVARVDTETAKDLVPEFLQDPSAELRRISVAARINDAKEIDPKKSAEQAKTVYQEALSGAVDRDQVEEIVGPLKEFGVDVNLQQHFGFLTKWNVVGPFENRGGDGFNVVYPPEKQVDIDAEYPTEYDLQYDKPTVKWQAVSTDDDYGIVDIRKDLTNWKGSCIYAVTEFQSDAPQTVQLRLGTPNAWKLWVNGEELFAREEYHRSTRMDQYRVPANFKAGRNVILLKVCQNEQTQDWAQNYQFQIRVSDGAGSAILPSSNTQ
ncbi:HEAT repeat domain-containing protein [Thalassoroseus pseudoceratinae]|uniref:HEAT repeat domain-containing protein n=1 Tax=Thalassoroseus pseudoceratinae TaxID=2713176 RepID=UPI00141F006D|nr:hypothetical protein [Thalassoroseus pseudoceratinae]